jgi:hypothetical protein
MSDELHTDEFFQSKGWGYFKKGDYIIKTSDYVGICPKSTGEDKYYDYLISSVYEITNVNMKQLRYELLNKRNNNVIKRKYREVYFSEAFKWEHASLQLKTLYQMDMI